MIAWITKHIRCYLLLLLFSFILSGCSVLRESVISTEKISDYAEALFKRQNNLTQQVMMLVEEDLTVSEEEKLTAAEEAMHEACHLLNEYANREIEGQKISILFRKQVQGSFDECEKKVIEMEAILNKIDEDALSM